MKFIYRNFFLVFHFIGGGILTPAEAHRFASRVMVDWTPHELVEINVSVLIGEIYNVGLSATNPFGAARHLFTVPGAILRELGVYRCWTAGRNSLNSLAEAKIDLTVYL